MLIIYFRGCARYDYSHAILGEEHSFFRNEKVSRDRRVSVICRTEPSDNPDKGDS